MVKKPALKRKRVLHNGQSEKELQEIREWRRNRFRILACIDGTEESYEAVRFAARIAKGDDCDIILIYVRPIDQGLRSGGLQVRVARQNILDWGLELPGIEFLKHGLEVLKEEGQMTTDWESKWSHVDVWSDPLGDNKLEYRHDSGKSIVLKLKTAPDAASGILDQYELGPYNLMILGEPSRWRGEFKSIFDAGVVQKVAMLSPCSVLVARPESNGKGHLICTDGTDHSMDAAYRDAVLAHYYGSPVTLFSVAPEKGRRKRALENLDRLEAMLGEKGIKCVGKITAVGNPVDEIVRAGKKFSVVCVSDSGKSRVKRFFVGSVAFDVMRHATTSVLNVR